MSTMIEFTNKPGFTTKLPHVPPTTRRSNEMARPRNPLASTGEELINDRCSLLSGRRESLERSISTYFVGVSIAFPNDAEAIIALAIRDAVYLLDLWVTRIRRERAHGNAISDFIIDTISKYQAKYTAKCIGAGVSTTLASAAPSVCIRLWLELDIVPIVFTPYSQKAQETWDMKLVDEQAESIARRCILQFGPSRTPILQVGWHGEVQVAVGFRAHLNRPADYERTCSKASWDTMKIFANSLKARKKKLAFFSSTPQGGGVALMRHSLIRFSRLLDLEVSWYVPKPRQGVFRITKHMHNILQGVSDPAQRLSLDDKRSIIDWATDNANRYWLSKNGPLRPPEEGGADVVVVDDPQMIGLVSLSKKTSRHRPVIFRSHIHLRSDLIKENGSSQADAWAFIWDHIKCANLFVSHPVRSFVPEDVPIGKVVYMPATSDWLDGLNKDLGCWDTAYYLQTFNSQCYSQRKPQLEWPGRQYIIQVARFDPSKGLSSVVESYAEFRRQIDHRTDNEKPQLVVCGNGSVDDPDGALIYDQLVKQVGAKYPQLKKDIIIVRLDPHDQVLNCLISHAHVVLQLSTHEGFEVKVSEALRKGKPVIATRVGGMPLQVSHGMSGFIVEPGDHGAVARHLVDLFTDGKLHKRMSRCAALSLSDEVSTVGNALAWYYLADRFTQYGEIDGNGNWVNDMARREAGRPYADGERRLPRSFTSSE